MGSTMFATLTRSEAMIHLFKGKRNELLMGISSAWINEENLLMNCVLILQLGEPY
jgi:hypothetical protein